MKKVNSLIVITAVLFDIASLWLFFLSLGVYVENYGMRDLLMYINSAKICFLISIVLWLWRFLKSRHKFENIDTKTNCFILIIIMLIGISSASIYAFEGYKSYGETRWTMTHTLNDDEEIKKHLPYHDEYVEGKEKGDFTIIRADADGMKYLFAQDSVPYGLYYEAEYFESKSILLNKRFIMDRVMPTWSNGFAGSVEGEVIKGENSGITYSFVVSDDKYAFCITANGYGFYATLDNVDVLDISSDEFAQTAFEQFKIMQNVFAVDGYGL